MDPYDVLSPIRRLNAAAVLDSCLIPRRDELIGSIGDEIVFTTLDENYGYWPASIDKRDSKRTAFTSNNVLYRFIRMTFGLKNAPDTFQRARRHSTEAKTAVRIHIT